MSQSCKAEDVEGERSEMLLYHGELKRMSWGDGFFAAATADDSLKNLICFVYLRRRVRI